MENLYQQIIISTTLAKGKLQYVAGQLFFFFMPYFYLR